MGLPFALNHINLWLLEDGDGWAVVDCGIANDATRSAWEQVFSESLDGRPITRVIVTHCHPDHVGLAAWLCDRWQVPLWMTVGEYGFARMMAAGLPGADGPAMIPHFRRHGLLDTEKLAQLEGRKQYYPTLVPKVPEQFIRLDSRTPIRIGAHTWRVIIGTGHSPEHAALYCESLNLLISGDMLLPKISTNTSSNSAPCRSKHWCCRRMANPFSAFGSACGNWRHTMPRGWMKSGRRAVPRALRRISCL
jgi:glyoxylase-like metal-dependent hydrolase (beta-lactamase superfamily II)